MTPVEITIADVARRAGVSVSTVSRILNNKPDVAAATRSRVQRVIDELNFRPHTQAQRLAAGSSRTIAFLHPIDYLNTDSTVAETDFILGAAYAAAEESFMCNLVTVPVTEESLIGLYRSAQVDGVILMEIHLSDWRVSLLQSAHLPFAMIGHCADNRGLTYIDLDFEASVMKAVEHLVKLGHRQIGFITYPGAARQNGYGPAVRALHGYETACRQLGLTVCYEECAIGVEAQRHSTAQLLEKHPGTTAIVTSIGSSVVGLLAELQARGLRVPEKMSVVAFMSKRYRQLISPPMTTLDVPGYTMGYRGAKMLIAKLQQPEDPPAQVLLPPDLTVGKSTAVPRAR